MATSIERWTIYRRPKDSNDSWESVYCFTGTKYQAREEMAKREMVGGEIDYEWLALKEGERMPNEGRYNDRMMRPMGF